MKRYDDTTYGERIAEAYDELYADYDEAAIDLLHELAGGGRVLELGIGSGRIALPLHHRGVDVMGIDASPAMIAKLHAKPDGAGIEVVQGSFAQIDVAGQFDLIYVVFNTFYALLTQAEQVQCFRSVAEHLTEAGVFLIEAFVPDLSRYDDRQSVRTLNLSGDRVSLDVAQLDPLTQQVASHHVFLSEEGIRLYPVKLRYAWPSEFDLMAQLAGLSLKHRWSSWEKDEFTAESGRHVSVYGR